MNPELGSVAVLWSGLLPVVQLKCSETLALLELLYNPRANKVFTSLHESFNCIYLLKDWRCPLKSVTWVMILHKRVSSVCYENCLKSVGLQYGKIDKTGFN